MYELPIKISHYKFYQNYDNTYFYQKNWPDNMVFIIHFHYRSYYQKIQQR